MKTKYKISLCLILFFLICGLTLSACSFNLATKVKQNISELAEELFFGENDDTFVTITSGFREQPFEYDGVCNESVDFCVVDVVFKISNPLSEIDAQIIINDTPHQITLEKNPFKSSFMFDLQKSIDASDHISFVFNEKQIDLTCKSKDFSINFEKALNIGIENTLEKLENLTSRGHFKGECYLKIINNPLQNSKLFYWFFSVKGQDGSTFSVIIDPNTGSVLAKY